MKKIILICLALIPFAGCAANSDKSMTVHGVTYDDQHWNGR